MYFVFYFLGINLFFWLLHRCDKMVVSGWVGSIELRVKMSFLNRSIGLWVELTRIFQTSFFWK